MAYPLLSGITKALENHPANPSKRRLSFLGRRVICVREKKSISIRGKGNPVPESDTPRRKKRPNSGKKSSKHVKKSQHPENTGEVGPDPTEILLKYWPQISFRVRKSIGRATPDWEDVASEILVGVIEVLRQKRFRGESSLGTFIYSVTTNKIIDHIRLKKRNLNDIPEFGHPFDPYVQVEKQERARQVTRYIKKLKPRYADILYLHYYLDLPQSEIAKIYGLSTGRMNKLIRAARITLKKLMNSLPPEGMKTRL